MFKPVLPKVDFPALERELLEKWHKNGAVKKYLHKNDNSQKQFSFLDGPITANNPMGVHHAWGRTYKDFWQRFKNMQGFRQRFQNGFDEQGLWVEVEVEKELGLKSKKDIENLVPGDKFKSLEKFINLCKERIKKYSAVQTEQSKRLGYFMDWDNSYHTSSDQNNYAIWNFLKVVHEKDWLYKGHDTVPWCPRCGTAISQHEILTEEYKEIAHASIYFRLPIEGRKNEYLLVWTTTPWTIPGNIAVAINPKLRYVKTDFEGKTYYLAQERLGVFGKGVVLPKPVDVKDLLGLTYSAPFDNLPRIRSQLGEFKHKVIDAGEIVTEEEGTGILHVAPGQGEEDFKLSREQKLPVIELIGEDAVYMEGMEEFSGENAKNNPEIIIEYLKKKDNGKYFFKTEKIKHRYPTCWRCKIELVWRVVDEWYIGMDKKDGSGKTYREQMIEVAKKIKWLPEWGLERELDWLQNMHDWLISKKRYWGLALPIWECQKCGNFEVVGSKEELKEKAVGDWDKFEGHTPHRPWVDQVKIKCSKCGEIISRIPDVGNPWLDAGIVSISTMPEDWFPADFITESFPGQFKNWFYSLIAMSTALKNTNPTKIILGHGSVRDEKGEEMHKSKGNAIEFNEAAEKTGVDVMRWLYLRTNPEHNVNFGYHVLEELRRLFFLKLWNVYSFLVTYANIYKWSPGKKHVKDFIPPNLLDKWILSRLVGNIKNITFGDQEGPQNIKGIINYNACDAVGNAEIFINDLSNWYVRRIRDRVGGDNIEDRSEALQTLWIVLTEFSKILAPFIPFMSEAIYTNLVSESESVHLADWPETNNKWRDNELEKKMDKGINLAAKVHAFRKEKRVKVRVPLKKLNYEGPVKIDNEIMKVVLEEVNVYELLYKGKSDQYIASGDTSENNQDSLAGQARELVRQIQELRKNAGCALDEKIAVYAPSWPKDFEEDIKKQTLAEKILVGEELKIEKHG